MVEKLILNINKMSIVSKKKVVLALSGGMDSSSLLIHLLAKGYDVKLLSFNYGQKHSIELEKAKSLVEFLKLNTKGVISHDVVSLDIGHLLTSSSLVSGGSEVPEGHYEQENMKMTVVPNRNKIFSSIIQAVALSWSQETSSPVEIAMGIHSGDATVYPDCREAFRDADYYAFILGNWEAEKVSYYTPYLELNKYDILLDGEIACKILGLDFDEVYKRTITSYKPIKIISFPLPSQKEEMPKQLQSAVEVWCSDYKSASSVERVEAFIKLDRKDPIPYADETGIVSWEKVVQEVQKVLNHEA